MKIKVLTQEQSLKKMWQQNMKVEVLICSFSSLTIGICFELFDIAG
jgi:hypothetical protein